MSQAIYDVIAERKRQVGVEGWTPEHDDAHDSGEMAVAAACYAAAHPAGSKPAGLWPWDLKWWKPRSHRENLVRAGALIIAEIERLDRKQEGASQTLPEARSADTPSPSDAREEALRECIEIVKKHWSEKTIIDRIRALLTPGGE